ncbi:MAG: RagB/SusD family nutrient uptake outer membrane protein, partial [Muribaculum sp.]|nr:RagB/SusD family nutrient uptake outer membrane protein [Muribaculum sp.]
MMKNSILKFAAVAAIATAAVSCTEIDTLPDGRVSFDEIWTQDRFVLGYLHDAYSPLLSVRYGQGYGYTIANLGGVSFLDAATDNAHDVDDVNGGPMYMWNNGMVSAASTPLTRLDIWSSFYRGIAHCNILIANIPTARIFVEEDREFWMAESHGLRALYYLMLLKNYGGVPLVLDTRIDENGNEVPDMVDDSDYDYSHARRASVAEVARQILKDCQFVLDSEYPGWRTEDDGSLGRINKAVACAVMSEAALFAASPLNYDANDPAAIDWAEAATITKKALDDCLAHGYGIFTDKPTSSGNADELAATAYDHMFLQNPNALGTTDKEMIMVRTQAYVWMYNTAPI